MKQKFLAWTIIILGIIGAAVSGYALAHHYDKASGEFCTLSETVSCDVVNKSPWSEFFGVPVALIGMIGYLFLVAMATKKVIEKEPDELLTLFMAFSAMVGFLISAYLTYIELYVIEAICLLCVTSQTLITILAVSAVLYRIEEKKCASEYIQTEINKE